MWYKLHFIKRDISSEMSLYFLLYLLYEHQIGTHKDEG